MRAAAARLQDGRGVTMAEAQGVEIWHELTRLLEGEAAVELQAIGGEWAIALLVRREAVEALGNAAGFGDHGLAVHTHGRRCLDARTSVSGWITKQSLVV